MFLKTAVWRPRQRKWQQKIDLESFQKIRILMLKHGEHPKFINQYEYLCYHRAYSIVHKSIIQTQHLSQQLETVSLESTHGHHPGHRASVHSGNEPAEAAPQGKPGCVSPSLGMQFYFVQARKQCGRKEISSNPCMMISSDKWNGGRRCEKLTAFSQVKN